MRKTKFCELFNIKYPVVQAPMAWIATAELVSAVSNAGGLGVLGPNGGMTSYKEANDVDATISCLQQQIRQIKTLTSNPFAVNLPVGWGKQRAITDKQVEIAIAEKVPIAVTSMGSSSVYTQMLKAAGIKVIHAVGCSEHACKAEADGVDAVVCEGYEAGGHLSNKELTTFVLVPQISDAVKIPVIAGGGIADGRGMAAALALGADGVYVGTRFMACAEAKAHMKVKEAVVLAEDTSTIVFARKTGISRCMKNPYTIKHAEMEEKGSSFEEMRDFERSCPALGDWRRVPGALVVGNIEDGSLPMGAIAGIIKDIPTAATIVKRLIDEYEATLKKL